MERKAPEEVTARGQVARRARYINFVLPYLEGRCHVRQDICFAKGEEGKRRKLL